MSVFTDLTSIFPLNKGRTNNNITLNNTLLLSLPFEREREMVEARGSGIGNRAKRKEGEKKGFAFRLRYHGRFWANTYVYCI